MSNTNIPSDEDFARADKLDREDWENIDAVNEAVVKHFKDKCPLHYFIIIPQRDNEFWAAIFFETDKNVGECEESGIIDEIKGFVYSELERQGRGKGDHINVIFEFDSDENVKRNFEGDYFLRLR